MKYSTPKLKESTFENDGILYFAQRLEEMLFDYSIDLFRMPLLNTHGLSHEYCAIAIKVRQSGVKEYQLTQIHQELVDSLKHDIVLKDCWGQESIDRIVKSFGSSAKEEILSTISYIDATFSKGTYYFWCEQTLKRYANQPKQKKKLESAIRCWIPELLSLGYSADYVYCELKKSFFSTKPVSAETLDDFLALFNFKSHKYSVYFSVSNVVLVFKDILQKRLNVQFEDDGNFLHYKTDRKKTIIFFNKVKAPCPNTAAKIAYQRLDLFFSFYKFVGNKSRFSIQKKAMVLETDGKPIFVDAHKFSYSIIESIDFENIGRTSDSMLTGLLINAELEYSLLRKSIELHNTALAVPDLKSGFLNLWASIEVLFQPTKEESKFESVLKNVIPILKKDYINSIVGNILTGLQDNISQEEYHSILDSVVEVGCENKKIFYLLFLPQYSELRGKCFDALTNFPVLRSRIALLAEMNTTKKLNTYIDKYIQRIEWHLYRMYRTRNAIIHSGEVPSNIKYLGEHLHSYVDSTLSEFLVKLSGDTAFKSVSNVITDVKFATNNMDNILSQEQQLNESIVNMLIHPEIGHVMHCEQHMSEQ